MMSLRYAFKILILNLVPEKFTLLVHQAEGHPGAEIGTGTGQLFQGLHHSSPCWSSGSAPCRAEIYPFLQFLKYANGRAAHIAGPPVPVVASLSGRIRRGITKARVSSAQRQQPHHLFSDAAHSEDHSVDKPPYT